MNTEPSRCPDEKEIEFAPERHHDGGTVYADPLRSLANPGALSRAAAFIIRAALILLAFGLILSAVVTAVP